MPFNKCRTSDPILIHTHASLKYSKCYSKCFSKHYRVSIRKKCRATYPRTRNTPQYTDKPIASRHKARVSNPKLDKIAEPGTVMSRPYLLSTKVKYLASLTMRPSKA